MSELKKRGVTCLEKETKMAHVNINGSWLKSDMLGERKISNILGLMECKCSQFALEIDFICLKPISKKLMQTKVTCRHIS